MDDNQHKTNVHSRKGKSGEHKRYYRGKRPKPRGKRQKTSTSIDFSGRKGEPVLFRRENRFLLGWLEDEICEGEYMVNSVKDGEGSTSVVNADHHPVLLSDLTLSNLERGTHVMFTWDSVPGEFLDLQPAVILCTEQEGQKVRIKPNDVHPLSVGKDEICACPYDVDLDDFGTGDVSPGDLNVVHMVVQKYESAIKETQLVFERTKEQLIQSNLEKRAVEQRLSNLNSLFEKALSTVAELRYALFESSQNKKEHPVRIRTLLELLATQREALNDSQRQILAQNKDILAFRHAVHVVDRQKEELLKEVQKHKEKWMRAEKERDQLAEQVQQLQQQNRQLASENTTLRGQQLVHLEQRPSISAGHPVVVARAAGSKGKPKALVPLKLPLVPRSSASEKTLESRAQELMKMTQMISSKDEPTEGDLVATLASFFRKYPQLASEACQKADLSLQKELTSGETLDLKLLLRLPMRKFRQLRTFFSNHGINIFSSDRSIYRELHGRRDTSDKVVEYGELAMKKTVAATSTSTVSFIRVRDLTAHLEELISGQAKKGGMWENANFNGEIWIKILGDKGGSSTKLAVQVCNFLESNSADKTDLLAMYGATDSYDNMSLVFAQFRDQLLQLQRNSQVRVGGESRICRVFLSGDYEFLTKVMGHMGPNAAYPCLWCYLPLQALSSNGQVHSPKVRDESGSGFKDDPAWFKSREPGEIVQDLSNNQADPRRGGNTKANGPYHHSIASVPILPKIHDILHIAPPILHIMLGLVVRFYRNIENLCKEKDRGNLGERDEGLYDRWQQLSVEVEENEREYLEAVNNQKYEENLLKGFKKVRRGRRASDQEPCSYPACGVARIEQPESIEWIQCATCSASDKEEGWYHKDCVGLRGVNVSGRYEGPICRGEVETPQDIIDKQEVIVNRHKEMIGELKRELDRSKAELNTNFGEVSATIGPLERKLGDVLEKDFGVQKQAYHSQCFVGNHCKLILENSDKLVDVLEDYEEESKYRELFQRLRDIFHVTCKTGFLTLMEVEELCQKCWDLGRWFPQTFPEERIPPKLHFLLCHVPECAKMWHTVGLLSEHGIESLHAQVNADERVFASVRDETSRVRLMFNNHGHRFLADTRQIETVKRKCTQEGCGGRYKTVSGVKRCQKCLHLAD